MMRRDVRFGFAIGGVLLAVLLVYFLVVAGGPSEQSAQSKSGATLEDGTPVTDVSVTGDKSVKPSPDKSVPDQVATRTPTETTGQISPTPDAGTVPNKNLTTPDTSHDVFESSPTPAKADSVASADSSFDWGTVLNPPPMMSSTPAIQSTPAPVTPVAPTGSTPTAGQTRSNTSTTLPPAGITNVSETHGATPTPATVSGQRTHKVVAGETLSAISNAAYGNSKYWTLIAKANPSINPNALKVGMVLNLPDVSNAASTPSSTSSTGNSTPTETASVDATRQYQVVGGDSLQKISSKLYGATSHWEAIYEANKQLIGSDPGRIKVGMILTLPMAPTVTASR